MYVISEPATPLARDVDQHPRHEIRLLIVDDSEDDALAVVNELKRGGYSPTFERVDTADAMISALKNGRWDVIVADYIMPSFSGLAALNLFKASGLNLPFILVSGKIGEDKAVEAMKAGATDYVMKDKLNRLVPAIERELGEAKVQRERRKAEEAIQRQEQRFRALIEHSSDVIVILSAEGKLRYVSASAEPMLGFGPEEATGMNILESVHPEDIQPVADSFARLLQKPGATVQIELRTKDKGGSWHTLEATATNLLHDPAVEGIVVNYRDVTEHKKAEDSLRESEKRYRLLAENVSDVIWVTDMNFRPTYLSPSVTRLLGYSMEEAMARGMQDSLTPASLKTAADAVTLALDAERKGQKDAVHMMPPLELEMVRKDGSTIWVASKVSFLYDSGGRPMEMMGVVHDITERKKAKEALQSSEQRFRALIENSSDAIIVANPDGTTRYVSPSLGRMLGEGRVGAGILEAVHPEDVQLVADNFASLLQNPGANSLTEVRIQHKDGSWHTIESTATNLIHDPAVEGIVINLRDVTERKKAEEALKESEERLRILFEFAPDGYYLSDLEGKFVDGNRAAEELTGYKREELIGKNFLELGLLTIDQLPIAAALLTQNIQGQATGPDELILKRKDGSHVAVEINTFPVKIKGQNLVLGNVRNVTERKKIKEALAESEKRYRLLAENISDVIWVIDMNLRPTYFSPSISRMTGYSVEETMARGMEKVLNPASIEAVSEIVMGELAKKGEPNTATRLTPVEVEMERKDGSKVWAEAAGTLLRGSDGQPVEIIGILRDITERKKAEQQLNESFQKLKRTLDGTIHAITLTVESRDRYTAGHQRRVAQLGCAIAREMGFTYEQIQAIRIAGLLHDIGKISVPQEILSKPGKLTDVEFQLIKVHSQVGYDILKNVEFPWPIADIVIQHHERMNGSGYPSGIREDKLLIEARILGVADVVEAMSSQRPYRPPLGIDKALEEISCNSGILYDPSVVNACLRLFDEKGFRFE